MDIRSPGGALGVFSSSLTCACATFSSQSDTCLSCAGDCANAGRALQPCKGPPTLACDDGTAAGAQILSTQHASAHKVSRLHLRGDR